MTVSDSQLDIIVELADEYLSRLRRGERPSVAEYVDRYPQLAGGIREVFPISAMMEDLASDAPSQPEGERDAEHPEGTQSAQPPGRLGDYRILREIGRGGMGIVYEAEHVPLGRHVALKVLHPGAGFAPDRGERFEREARAAAKLHHTNIVPVFDVGEEDGTTFYAMQFIRGEGLDKVLDELRRTDRIDGGGPAAAAGSAPGSSMTAVLRTGDDSRLAQSGNHYWRSVARIGIQVADALDHAHSQGTLHRDIKPSNLLLDRHGTIWITDFGLARLEDEAGLTQSGDIVGTLRYMAPERFEGQCDARSDVYCLGLTLYELATLRPAFRASSRHRLIEQVTQQEPPRPRKVNPAIPRDLETIVLKAVAREPQRRYQSAGELRADLARFVENKPITARRSGAVERGWKWAKRRPLVAALLAAVVLSVIAGVTGVVWQWREADTARDAALRLAAQKQGALEEKTLALEDAARANRDARHALARNYEANGLRLFDRGDWHLAALWFSEALAIDAEIATAEPAGQRHRLHLGRRRLANLWRASPRLVQLKSFPSYRWHYLSDDGSVCITDDGHNCHVWDTTTGRTLYPPVPGQLASPHAVAPDGRRLLLFDSDGVRVHDLQTGRQLRSLEHEDVMLASWACRGERIVAFNLKGVLRIWDPAARRLVGPDRSLGGPPAVYRSLLAFTISGDGERVAIAVSGKQIPVYDARTGVLIQQVETPTRAVGVTLSSDGERLAVQSGCLQVWNIGSQPGTPSFQTPLDSLLGRVIAFSPDGRRIAFGNEQGVVHVRDLESGKDVFPPLVHAAGIHSIAFSPDGTRLVTAGHDETVRLWDASSGRPIGPVLWHEQSAIASFGSQGRRIVTATRSGVIRIWDLSSMGKPMALRGHDSAVRTARFSRDGRRLVTGGSDRTVRVWDPETGRQALPPREAGNAVHSISLSDEGRLVLVRSADNRVRLWDTRRGQPATRGDNRKLGEKTEPIEFSNVRLAQIDPAGRRLLLARDRRYGIFDRNMPIDDSRFTYLGSVWDRTIGAAFDAAGRRVLVYSNYGSVHVVDAATRKILLKRPPKPDHRYPDVVWAGFASNEDEVAVVLADGTVERWRIATARKLAVFKTSVEPVHVDVNRRGDRLVIAGRDHTVRVWDPETGRPCTPPSRHAGRILHLAFSMDGEMFVTSCLDGRARVWDTASGQPLTPFLRHDGGVNWAEFRPDGRQFVTAGADATVRLWPLAVAEQRPVEEFIGRARLYSARRIEAGAATIPMTGRELEQLFKALQSEDAPP